MDDAGEINTGGLGGHMIAIEFLSEFRKTQDVFNWKYVENGQIRGFLKSGEIAEAFDPIAATLFINRQTNHQVSDPGEALGLSVTDSEAINDAANGSIWKSLDGKLALDGFAAWLRDEIALAVDLEPCEVPQATPTQLTGTAVNAVESLLEPEPQHV